MGDVAAILGVNQKSNIAPSTGTSADGASASSAPANGIASGSANARASASANVNKAPQPPSLKPSNANNPTIPIDPKVLKIITNGGQSSSDAPMSNSNSDPLPPIVPDAVVRVNNRFIHSGKKARPWCWANFSSSARNDGLLLHHWVRAGVEYPEYPFARFNIHMDALNYRDLENIGSNRGSNGGDGMEGSGGIGGRGEASGDDDHLAADEFYDKYLHDDNWTQTETDDLLELCRVYELRWPVIIDRWVGKFGSTSSKKVEDLQHRYYTIGMILNKRLVEKAARVEAENLAKALAASESLGPGVGSGMVGGVGNRSMMGGSGGMEAKDSVDGTSTESLRAQQALASAISTSNSTAITSLGIKGDGSGVVPAPPVTSGMNTSKNQAMGAGANVTSSGSQTNTTSAIKANMQPPIASTNTGTTNQAVFDLDAERQRRRILEKIWHRSKEEEIEEQHLRHEIKLVEAQLRKLKKSGGHILAATRAAVPGGTATSGAVGGTGSQAPSVANSAVPTPASSRGTSPIPPGDFAGGTVGNSTAATNNVEASYAMLDAQFASSAPIPTPGIPYLQSGRLKQPTAGGQMGISKTTLKRMEQVLKELNVNERPLPTKRVCDMYDHVRKGILTLLTLQKVMLKKESEVINRRNKLEKVAGETVAREIAAKAEAAHAAKIAAEKAAAKAAAVEAKSKPKGSGGKSSASGGGKGKASGGGSKSKSTKKKATGDKSGTKRKAPSKSSSKTSSKKVATGSSKSAAADGNTGSSSASKTASKTTSKTTSASTTKTSPKTKTSGSSPVPKSAAKTTGDTSEAKTNDGDGGQPKKKAKKN